MIGRSRSGGPGVFGVSDAVAAPPSDHELRVTQFFLEVSLSTPAPVIVPASPCSGGGVPLLGVNPDAGDSLCGEEVPVTWCEITYPDGVIRRYAKVPINVGDPKDPRALSFGSVRRAVSNAFGENRGSVMSPVLSDYDGALRAADEDDSLVGCRYSQYVSSKRRLQLDPTSRRRVFDGIITDAQPEGQRTFSLQVTDYLSGLLDEFHKRTFPQRVFTIEDFPNMGNPDSDPVSPGNPTMLGKPVPVLYGNLGDEAEDVPVGVVPWIFTGRVAFSSLGGQLWDEYICAGHALGGWQSHFVASGGGLSTGTTYPSRVQINVDSGLVEVAWPGTAIWAAEFGSTPYIERNGNRYAAMYMFGPRSDLSRLGKVPHVSNLCGIEDVGDGTGQVISDLYLQILHLLTNWVFSSYAAGAWLDIPTVGAGAELYSRIDTTTIEAVKALRDTQITGGVPGAFILGHSATALTFDEILTLAAKNGQFDYGENRHGQLFFDAHDPDAPINRQLSALADVIAGTYKAKRRRDLIRNVLPYNVGRRYVPPLTEGAPAEGELLPATTTERNTEWYYGGLELREPLSVTKYGERPERMDFEMIRDQDVATELVQLALDESAPFSPSAKPTAPVTVTFDEGTCGVDTDLGDKDSLVHFDALTDVARSIRCEEHTLDLDSWVVSKAYREVAP